MTKQILFAVLTLISLTAFAQQKMKTTEELINNEEPGWTIVLEWINNAKNNVEVLSVDTLQAKNALYKLQVTTRSPMGAITYMTGGILIDNGWIRILGSGNTKLKRTLPDWNKLNTDENNENAQKYLLIADDAIGGFFILNGGELGTDLGKIYYFSPDNLEYEPLDLTYSEFIIFCFNNDLNEFYKNLRWKNWKDDVEKLDGDKVFNFYPYLWSKEGKNINKSSRKIIPIEEQLSLNLNLRKQIGIEK